MAKEISMPRASSSKPSPLRSSASYAFALSVAVSLCPSLFASRVHAVLIRVHVRLDALAAFERIELAIGIVVPDLEVPGDRQARLGHAIVVRVNDTGAEHPPVHVLGVAVVVRVRRGELVPPAASG